MQKVVFRLSQGRISISKLYHVFEKDVNKKYDKRNARRSKAITRPFYTACTLPDQETILEWAKRKIFKTEKPVKTSKGILIVAR